jgi:uncharacterized membrane protein YheB (UPF0754 family)
MVFAPLKPVRLGPWRIQGLFVRRQPQVSEAYATFFAERILTPDALLRAVLSGPASSQLVALVERHVSAAMDDVLGVSRPLLGLALGQEGYADLRQAVAARTVDDVLPLAAEAVSEHLDDRLGLQALVSSRLAALAPARFVGVLRPVFQADEWVLTSIGVALGVVAGVVQATLTLAT